AETNNLLSSVTSQIILILVFVAILFAVFSIAIIWLLVHNFYAASYYTISALFDANGENSATFITAAIHASSFGGAFYELVAVSLIDGIAKAVIVGFILAAFIELLSNIDIKSKLDIISSKRLKNHVIICGYSMLAERLCKDLTKQKAHFVIIDNDYEKVNYLRDLSYNVIDGDFTEKKILESASLGNAKAIIFATESDFVNLLGIVTAHHMYPNVKIVARARSESSVRKLQRGGAELCLVPEVVAGIELGERILKV
ncbi:MAG: NAD-binding protein, partial [Candidatus Micrarchaeaceae archaeon]